MKNTCYRLASFTFCEMAYSDASLQPLYAIHCICKCIQRYQRHLFRGRSESFVSFFFFVIRGGVGRSLSTKVKTLDIRRWSLKYLYFSVFFFFILKVRKSICFQLRTQASAFVPPIHISCVPTLPKSIV